MVKYLCSMSDIFASQSAFLNRSLTLGILFSTVVRVAVAAKLAILGISPSNSFVLALRKALVAN